MMPLGVGALRCSIFKLELKATPAWPRCRGRHGRNHCPTFVRYRDGNNVEALYCDVGNIGHGESAALH